MGIFQSIHSSNGIRVERTEINSENKYFVKYEGRKCKRGESRGGNILRIGGCGKSRAVSNVPPGDTIKLIRAGAGRASFTDPHNLNK